MVGFCATLLKTHEKSSKHKKKHTHTNKKKAKKEIPAAERCECAENFIKEVLLLKYLNASNDFHETRYVPQVLDEWEDAHSFYYAMTYFEGKICVCVTNQCSLFMCVS